MLCRRQMLSQGPAGVQEFVIENIRASIAIRVSGFELGAQAGAVRRLNPLPSARRFLTLPSESPTRLPD